MGKLDAFVRVHARNIHRTLLRVESFGTSVSYRCFLQLSIPRNTGGVRVTVEPGIRR